MLLRQIFLRNFESEILGGFNWFLCRCTLSRARLSNYFENFRAEAM